MITIGSRLDDCSVEDLGSTNKSHVIDESGEPQTMNPGTVYRLNAQTQLVFGDVQAVFEFVGGADTAGDSSLDSRGRAEIETIKTAGTSTHASGMRMRTGATTTTGRKSMRSSVTSNTGKRDHRALYQHAKDALGMSMPYDRDLLWIAEASMQMPLPEGWEEVVGDGGQTVYKNLEVNVETDVRPQTLICRNLFQESRRKMDMEEATGTALDDDRLPRLLLLDPSTGVNLFHYVLPGRNTVGKARESCDIWLNSRACSKQHGYIEVRDSRFFLGDLGSTNGTFFGEFPSTASRQVTKGQEEEVTDGQLIMFGDVECTLSAPSGGTFTRTADPGSARSSAPSSARSHGSGRDAQALADAAVAKALASQGVMGAGGATVDYEEIRKIIREEVSAVAAASAPLGSLHPPRGSPPQSPKHQEGDQVSGKHGEGQASRQSSRPASKTSSAGRASAQTLSPRDSAAGLRETSKTEGLWDRVENEKMQAIGEGHGAKVTKLAQPKQMTYDVNEELRLAAELERVEGYVNEHVNEVRNVLGVEERTGITEGVPSRRKGFLARQEQRRQMMIDIGKKHYRKQAPYSELGAHLLPTGALHRILANLAAIPYYCIIAPVCKQLRSAVYCTQPWTTDNGDYCAGLWGRVVLKATRCADGHTLLSGLGPERLGFVKEMDLSGVLTITDDTLAAVAEQCPLLEVLLLKRRVDVGPQITDIGVEDIAACCHRLKNISLAWCSKVSDASVLALADGCPELEILDVSFCHSLTDKGVMAALEKCSRLEVLLLEACDRVSEQCIVALAQLVPRVKTLSLAGCTLGATTMSVIQIARSCELLTSIDLTGIAGLQDAAL
jgi:pSer/pThr/pTyr-binding forkhead associated (FHA) protein